MNSLLSVLGDRVTGVLQGFDRLRFAGTQRMLSHLNGLKAFLQCSRVLLKDFGTWSADLTAQMRRSCETVMMDARRPMLYLNRSDLSKEQLAESIRQRDGIKSGPVCQLSAVEPLLSYEIHRNRSSKRLELHPLLRKCLHLYHYWVDEQVGMMHVRLATWLPFGVKLCINGREWLCRELSRAGVSYERHDNCLKAVSDLSLARMMLEQQLKTDWKGLLDRAVRRSFPAAQSLLKLHGEPLDYYFSLEQSEWASDLLFKNAACLREIYPRLIRYGMTAMSCDSVLRFLGRRIDRRFEGQVQSDLRRREEGVRLKHSVNNNSVKMYDKASSVLRIETTLHNPRDLRVYRGTESNPEKKQWRPLRKGIADLHRRSQVSQACNDRYMEALSQAELSETVGQQLAGICQSVTRNARRYRAIRPLHENDMTLLAAVSRGEWMINGFRNQDVRKQLWKQQASDAAERKRRSGRVSRQLALLHAHGLIRKVPRTRRWLPTSKGQATAAILNATQSTPASRLLSAA